MKSKDKKPVRVLTRKIRRNILKNQQGNNRINQAWKNRQNEKYLALMKDSPKKVPNKILGRLKTLIRQDKEAKAKKAKKKKGR